MGTQQEVGFYNKQFNPLKGGRTYDVTCVLDQSMEGRNYRCKQQTGNYNRESELVDSAEYDITTEENNLSQLFQTNVSLDVEESAQPELQRPSPSATQVYVSEPLQPLFPDIESRPVKKKRVLIAPVNVLPNAEFNNSFPPKFLSNPHEVFVEYEVLGSGSYGRVVGIRVKETGAVFALKLIAALDNNNRSTLNAFIEEVDTLIEVSSYPNCNENIVCYYDSFQLYYSTNPRSNDTRLYYGILMEYVYGITLHDYLELTTITIEIANKVFQWLTSTLATLHEQGIVHRDIKPKNIMVQPDGQLKLIDFGFGCIIGNPKYEYCRKIVGSPHFVAPEIANGSFLANLEYLKKGDVFSAGVTLYQTVEGVNNFPYNVYKSSPITKFKLNPYFNEMNWNDQCYDTMVRLMVDLVPEQRPEAEVAFMMFSNNCVNPIE